MGFIILLILAALSLASSAAFFSIYGLAKIFTGAFWPVVIMAVALEIAKLVSTSFVYRYWVKLTLSMRGYLISAILVLMLITSMGIFGFLSGAYQQDILPLQLKEQKITLLEQEKQEVEHLKQEKLDRKKQIDADIASLPNNFITGRQRLMRSYGPELDKIREDLAKYTQRTQEITLEMQKIKSETLQEQVHIGPIVYIAEAFNQTTNEATKWLIFLIIFAFDPLAVVLVIGTNLVVIDRQKRLGTYLEEEPHIIHREIVEREIVDREVSPPAAAVDLESLFEKLQQKMKPTEEEEKLKAAIGQLLRREQISRNIRTGKT